MSLVMVRDLQIRFKTPYGILHAVRGVDFTIERGEMLALVGETGCGKSVIGRSLMRLMAANATVDGSIIFDGVDLLTLGHNALRALRGRRISMIFQDASAALNPTMTIGDQFRHVFRKHGRGTNRRERSALALSALQEVGLESSERIMKAYPHQLSGGQQQRAMIALALAGEPDLLIADEPTTALDMTTQAQILNLLVRLQQERRFSILLITHDLSIVTQTCQRVLVLYAGRVAELGTVDRVFSQPAHPYTSALLAALPEANTRGNLQAIPGTVQSGLHPLNGCAFAPRCLQSHPVCNVFAPPIYTLNPQDSPPNHHCVACVLHRDADEVTP